MKEVSSNWLKRTTAYINLKNKTDLEIKLENQDPKILLQDSVYTSSTTPYEIKEKTVSGITWTPFKNYLTNEFLKLETKRLGKTRDGVLIVEFQITGKTKEVLKPEWVWVTQNNEARPIQQLFLSALEISGKDTIQGVLQLQNSDVDNISPLKIELRRGRTSFLTIPKVHSWK